MQKIHYPDLFAIYHEGFKMKTGNKSPIVVDEDLSFSQQPTSQRLVFDSLQSEFYFPSLNDSNSFGTVDYDCHNNTKIGCTHNHVYKFISIQEHFLWVCELERTQLLTISAMSV